MTLVSEKSREAHTACGLQVGRPVGALGLGCTGRPTSRFAHEYAQEGRFSCQQILNSSGHRRGKIVHNLLLEKDIFVSVLYSILKFAVVTVLLSSLIEALVLSFVRGWSNYDWRAAGLSLVDFLVREYPLRWFLPLAFYPNFMDWIYAHRLVTMPMDSWIGWVACMLGQEFFYYWYHRAAHRVRWFWCTHSIHHSPNQLCLSAAYRFGWTGRATGTLMFFTLAPLLGMPPRVVLIMLSLNLLYQFWIHATWIPRLGPLEYILNTPSAHRVHHASNLEYLDGNYGGVLIIFDRLFGTYIAEKEDLPCRYGLVKPMTSYNLLVIEFDQWLGLGRDLRRSRSVREALSFLLKPPGWRPDGFGETTQDLRRRAGTRDVVDSVASYQTEGVAMAEPAP